MIKKGNKGSALIEVVIVASIVSLVSFTFLGAFSFLSGFHKKNTYSIKGALLAEEGLEILRLVEGEGWHAISTVPLNEERFFSISASSWSTSTVEEVIDGVYYRSFMLSSVERDAGDDIVASGGTVDPNTLHAQVRVEWDYRGATSTVRYDAYLFNL